MVNLRQLNDFFRKKGIFIVLHIFILMLSVLLIVMISIDTFKGIEFYEQPKFKKWMSGIAVLDMSGIHGRFLYRIVPVGKQKALHRDAFYIFSCGDTISGDHVSLWMACL